MIATAFFGAALAVPASAAVKAGAACSKAGLVNTSAGKKFTCIKSGKKLVWNKGVAVAKPAVIASPTPSVTPEPVVEKLPALPTSFSDLEENFAGIPYATWQQIQKNLTLYKSTDLKISFLFGPNTPERYPNQWTIDAVTLGSRVMGGQKQPAEVKFVEFNNKNQHDYLGLSFIIKNGLIILIVIGYYYFHRTLRKTKESIKQTQEIIKKDSVSNSNEKVKSLDDFLSDDEINR